MTRSVLTSSPRYSVFEHHLTHRGVIDCKILNRKVVHHRIDLDNREVDAMLGEGASGQAGTETAATSSSSSATMTSLGTSRRSAHDETLFGSGMRELGWADHEAYELLQDECGLIENRSVKLDRRPRRGTHVYALRVTHNRALVVELGAVLAGERVPTRANP